MAKNSALITLATIMSLVGNDGKYSYDSHVSLSTEKCIKHVKHSKDGRKVEYYTDEKGNIRRRKRNDK